MVRAFRRKPLNVSEQAEQRDLPQPDVSRHLRLLRESGILVTARAGREASCTIAPVFRATLSRTGNWLDLGCRWFDFGASLT